MTVAEPEPLTIQSDQALGKVEIYIGKHKQAHIAQY